MGMRVGKRERTGVNWLRRRGFTFTFRIIKADAQVSRFQSPTLGSLKIESPKLESPTSGASQCGHWLKEANIQGGIANGESFLTSSNKLYIGPSQDKQSPPAPPCRPLNQQNNKILSSLADIFGEPILPSTMSSSTTLRQAGSQFGHGTHSSFSIARQAKHVYSTGEPIHILGSGCLRQPFTTAPCLRVPPRTASVSSKILNQLNLAFILLSFRQREV